MAWGWTLGVWLLRLFSALLSIAYNLLPIYGLRHWGWDAFQLLILYWTETLVFAAWVLVRIAYVPSSRLGNMTINGREVPATHRMMILFFAAHSGAFIAVHLLFLCILFSGDWFHRLHGAGHFFQVFFVESGMWLPLLFAIVGGGFEFLSGEFHPQFVDAIARRFGKEPKAPSGSGDVIGGIVLTLYGRIVVMQIAIIGGAWAASIWGSLAPLYIIITLKTLHDFFAKLFGR